MLVLLRKWIRANKIARVVVAIAYLFITFTIPLRHVCSPCQVGSLTCRFDNAHNCHCNTCTDVQSDVALEKNNGRKDDTHRNAFCPACMYSITGKTTEVNFKATSIGTEIIISTIPLLHSNIVKKVVWAFPIALRAPPVINS